jgi:hypothetical protein
VAITYTRMNSRAAQPYPQPDYAPERQAFQHTHTHIGAGSGGHWLKMAGILSPLVIGELVPDDPVKRWRWIRIISVIAAFGAEALYTARIQRERQRCENERGCRR